MGGRGGGGGEYRDKCVGDGVTQAGQEVGNCKHHEDPVPGWEDTIRRESQVWKEEKK